MSIETKIETYDSEFLFRVIHLQDIFNKQVWQ